jgi:hypothetical protein
MYREGNHYAVDWRTGCWRWQLFLYRGYGRVARGQAHRAVYQELVGPIPHGYDLHHTCPNLDCVNPST